MNSSRKQKLREQTCGCQAGRWGKLGGGGAVERWTGSLELVDAYYIQNGWTIRPYGIAQCQCPRINHNGKEYVYIYNITSDMQMTPLLWQKTKN